MGTFKIKCPSCNQTLEADEAWEGMELPCPKCNHLFSLHKPIPQLRISADEHLVQDDTKPIIPETTTKNPITGNSIHEPSTEENPIKDSTATEKPVNVLQLEQLTLPALKKLYIRSQWLVVFGVLCIILSLASIGLAFFVSLKFLLALPALLLASFIFIKSRSMAARILFFFIGGGLTLHACIGISMTWLDASKSSHLLTVPGAFVQSIVMLIWVLIFSGIFLSACQRTLFGSNGFSHRQIAFVYKRRKKNLTFTAEELPKYKRTSRKIDMIVIILFVVTAFSAWAIAFFTASSPEVINVDQLFHEAETIYDSDRSRSFDLYQEAAKRGHRLAQAIVGGMLLKGDGVDKNEAEAIKWLIKAADNEVEIAFLILAEYYSGMNGNIPNYQEFYKWSKKAADAGVPYGKTLLGICYNEGWGCTENQDKARQLLQEAADQEEPNAKKILGL